MGLDAGQACKVKTLNATNSEKKKTRVAEQRESVTRWDGNDFCIVGTTMVSEVKTKIDLSKRLQTSHFRFEAFVDKSGD